MYRSIRSSLMLSAALFGSVTLSANMALAQDAGTTGGLGDIIVTSQKRAQNVQDTPLAVTAVSGDALAAAGVTRVEEMTRIDPALQIGHATGTLVTFIRGIGNPVTTAGNEASVPVYIDDVYYVRASAPFFELANIDRVEVLKGPQGTLFGRNASGGVISLFTKDPSFQKPELRVNLGYGNYDTRTAKLYASTPITDNLAADISVAYRNQMDGYGTNLFNNMPVWRDQYVSLRSKVVWAPTDSTTVKAVAYYQDSYNTKGIYARPIKGTVSGSPDGLHNPGAVPVPGYPNPTVITPQGGHYDVNYNLGLGSSPNEMYDDSEGSGFSVRIDQETPLFDITSITAARKNDELYNSEGDFSQYEFGRYQLNILDKQESQELQLKSKAESPVSWIVGAYYLNAFQGFDPTRISGEGYAAGGIADQNIYGKQRVKSRAGFGQVTVPVTDKFNVTGGLRYTSDKVEGVGDVFVSFLPGVPFVGGQTLNVLHTEFGSTFKKWTYKGAADYHFSDDVMGYASYSRGFKSGTHNTLPLDSPALKPEVVDAYEIGLKSEFLDSRIRLNTALFWNDISDPQVQAQKNGLVALINAGAARTKGVEADATIVVTEGLQARLSAAYLDAKFRDFTGCPTYTPSPTSPGNLDQIFTDCSGNRMPYASKFKGSAGLNYTLLTSGIGKFEFDTTANYTGKFNWDGDNVHKQGSYVLWDAGITYTPEANENVSARFWAKNILAEKYNINYYAQASGASYTVSPGEPFTYGLELEYRF